MTRNIDARGMDFQVLNELLRNTEGDAEIEGCLGQRFIGAGMGKRSLKLHGVPGNALGAYLNGGEIEVFGNAQDAVGDTMNAGTILVHGSIGDTAGKPIVSNYPCTGMHGGKLFLRSDCRDILFPKQVTARSATPEDLSEIGDYLAEYCRIFGLDCASIMASPFTVVTPDSANPYRQMYVAN